MYLVKHGYFQSCDKDGSYTIQSAIAKTPSCKQNFKALPFYRTDFIFYCQSKLYIAGIGNFMLFCSCDIDLDPMTSLHK